MCTEIPLYDVQSIDAVPVADVWISAAAYLATELRNSDFVIDPTRLVRIAAQDAGAGIVPLLLTTRGGIRDEESDGVAGRVHTVTLTADVNEKAASSRAALRRLELRPHTLLIRFIDGRSALVVATKDSYLVTTSRDGSKAAITLRIHTAEGLRYITY